MRADLVLEPDTIISQAIQFAVINEMPPTFFEFGVWWGSTLIRTYHSWCAAYETALTSWSVEMDPEQQERARTGPKRLHLTGFDSFEGLPPLEPRDEGGFFRPAQFRAGLDGVQQNLEANGVPADAVTLVPGWYEQLDGTEIDRTTTATASIVHIDCDLYSSTRDALAYVTDFLDDGTILIFDDWNHYRGHPDRGERRAFREWSEATDGWCFHPFRTEGPFRQSFIASRLDGTGHPEPPVPG